MTWTLTDPDDIVDDIKDFGPNVQEAWERISPEFLDLPYPRHDKLLRIKNLTDHTYQLMLFPHQVWVSYHVKDQVVRLLSVETIEGEQSQV